MKNTSFELISDETTMIDVQNGSSASFVSDVGTCLSNIFSERISQPVRDRQCSNFATRVDILSHRTASLAVGKAWGRACSSGRARETSMVTSAKKT